jgi:uncharacterized protein YcfJ
MKSYFDDPRRTDRGPRKTMEVVRTPRSQVLVTIAALLIPTAALADPPPWAPAHGRRAKEAPVYEPTPIRADEHIWRGDDGNYHCRRSDGSTGLVVGAAVGALVGNRLASGDRTLGTVLGAAGGGLLGRQIDRGNIRCR